MTVPRVVSAAAVITSVLPDVGHDLGVSDSAAGQLITAFARAYAVGAVSRRPLLIGSLAVFVPPCRRNGRGEVVERHGGVPPE